MLRNATTRLIAVHLALVTVLTAAVLGLFTWTARALIDGEIREVVTAEAQGLADDYARGGALALARAIGRRIDTAAERDAIYLLTDAYGRTIVGNLADWPPTVAPGAGWVELDLYRTDRARAAPVAALSFRLPGGERLLVGRDAQARIRLEAALARAGWFALAAALRLSLATGWLHSRLVLGRIGEVRRAAEDIVSGDLGRRVPRRGTGDEFDRLADTLNAMLDRIGALVESLRAVTDSLAHDLRSPLTRLRAQTARLAEPDLDPEARAAIAARTTAEADALLATFAALIEIARAEAGIGREAFEPVDLAALVRDVGELYAPVAADREVAIAVSDGAAAIAGSRQLLAQALSNLIENALRHAPAGSTVRVESGQEGGAAVLRVADAGPGIPEADRERVLGRFVTLDPSRGEGGGLGLALVAAVARLHGGSVALSDADPGLVAALTLPADPGGAPAAGAAEPGQAMVSGSSSAPSASTTRRWKWWTACSLSSVRSASTTKRP